MNKKSILYIIIVTVMFIAGIVSIKTFFAENKNAPSKSIGQKINYLCDIHIYKREKGKGYDNDVKSLKRSADPFAKCVLITLGIDKTDPKIYELQLSDKNKKDISILSLILKNPSIQAEELMNVLDTFSIHRLDIKISFWKGFENSGWINSQYLVQHPQSFGPLKELTVDLYQLDMLEFALKGFKELVKVKVNDKIDPEIIAWYGSALTRRALFAENNIQKIDFVKEGIKYLDQAAYDFPEFAVVRYIRANTYIVLPVIFNKDQLLKEDINYIVTAYKNGSTLKIQKDLNTVASVNVDQTQLFKIVNEAKKRFKDDNTFIEILETIQIYKPEEK